MLLLLSPLLLLPLGHDRWNRHVPVMIGPYSRAGSGRERKGLLGGDKIRKTRFKMGGGCMVRVSRAEFLENENSKRKFSKLHPIKGSEFHLGSSSQFKTHIV